METDTAARDSATPFLTVSAVHKLDPSQCGAIARLYEGQPRYFPLIGAVLEGAQNGTVFADSVDAPGCAFVQHAFGFAQVFGAVSDEDEQWLEQYVLIDRAFEGQKLRLYAPAPRFLKRAEHQSFRSERQRFHLARPAAPWPVGADGVACVNADDSNIAAIEAAFGVVTRFWRTSEEFISGSFCVLVTQAGAPAALCYGAAVASARAEIDVLTLPGHRKLGLGRVAVEAFNARCVASGVAPLWDCFTNNAGSMNLARAVGFAPSAPPYAFFTIPK